MTEEYEYTIEDLINDVEELRIDPPTEEYIKGSYTKYKDDMIFDRNTKIKNLLAYYLSELSYKISMGKLMIRGRFTQEKVKQMYRSLEMNPTEKEMAGKDTVASIIAKRLVTLAIEKPYFGQLYETSGRTPENKKTPRKFKEGCEKARELVKTGLQYIKEILDTDPRSERIKPHFTMKFKEPIKTT